MVNAFTLLRTTFDKWTNDRASSLAAAVAFYTLVSMAPLLSIVIAVAGAIFGAQAARGEVYSQIRDFIGSDAARFIQSAIDNAAQAPHHGWIASAVSFGVLLFGATKVFSELQDSLNSMWGVKPRQMKTRETIWNFVRKRVLSFAMVLVIAFLLLVSLVASAVLAALTGKLSDVAPGITAGWQPVSILVSLVATTVLFAMMYMVLPDVKLRWRDTWVGALMTSFLFGVGRFLIGLYLGNASIASTYGAAGALVVTVMWVFYSAQILFFGAEFTHVYAAAHGVAIVPDDHAVRVVVKEKVIDDSRVQRRARSWMHPFH